MRIGRERRKLANFKVCPRCGLKTVASAESCNECGLVFSRLDIATNKDAKRKIKRHDRDFIIKTSKLPSDVSRIKLLLLTIFTGLFGGHCFYVGRYWRGGLLLGNFVALIMYVVFNADLIVIDGGKLLAALTTISGLIMLVWLFDIIWVVLKKFKVPVAIDLESENSDNVYETTKEDASVEEESKEDESSSRE